MTTSPFTTIRFTDKLEDPSIEPATVIEENETSIISRRGAEIFPSFKSNLGKTWVGFSSREEHARFYAEHCRKKEAEAIAAVATAADKVTEMELKRAAIFSEVAKQNDEQVKIWSSDPRRDVYSLWQLSVLDDESEPVDRYEKSFCYSLTLAASTPAEALSYVSSSVSDEIHSLGNIFDHLLAYSDTRHLWSDPRYILIEYLGSSIKKELRCLSMKTYTSSG